MSDKIFIFSVAAASFLLSGCAVYAPPPGRAYVEPQPAVVYSSPYYYYGPYYVHAHPHYYRRY